MIYISFGSQLRLVRLECDVCTKQNIRAILPTTSAIASSTLCRKVPPEPPPTSTPQGASGLEDLPITCADRRCSGRPMWEPLHEFTFDADARDVFVHILGLEPQCPRRIVLTNHSYWFVCEFRPRPHGAALYAVGLHARLYGEKAGSKPGQLGRAPWNWEVDTARSGKPDASGRRAGGAHRARRNVDLATVEPSCTWRRTGRAEKWQYEDVKGELVDMTGVTFLVAVWRDLLEEWIEGRTVESEKSPWGDWSPNAVDIALLRDVIEDRRA